MTEIGWMVVSCSGLIYNYCLDCDCRSSTEWSEKLGSVENEIDLLSLLGFLASPRPSLTGAIVVFERAFPLHPETLARHFESDEVAQKLRPSWTCGLSPRSPLNWSFREVHPTSNSPLERFPAFSLMKLQVLLLHLVHRAGPSSAEPSARARHWSALW